MNAHQESDPSGHASGALSQLLAGGDSSWTHQRRQWQERQLALPWPSDLLQSFCLRMASRGMCVSQAMMLCDRRYALEQLGHAHNMGDEVLRQMAMELFRHDESRQNVAARRGGVH